MVTVAVLRLLQLLNLTTTIITITTIATTITKVQMLLLQFHLLRGLRKVDQLAGKFHQYLHQCQYQHQCLHLPLYIQLINVIRPNLLVILGDTQGRQRFILLPRLLFKYQSLHLTLLPHHNIKHMLQLLSCKETLYQAHCPL